MTNLNFELPWYFRTWISICRSVSKIYTNMCSIQWYLIRPGPMLLGWVTKPKPCVRLSKMTDKKSKSAKRAFLGGFLTFWVNLIRRIQILQKFWLLDNVYPRYRPSKMENDKKVKKWTKNHSLISLCFWVIRPWRTRISTRFWWFYDPLPRYGSLKMQNRPKLTVNGAKIKVWVFSLFG